MIGFRFYRETELIFARLQLCHPATLQDGGRLTLDIANTGGTQVSIDIAPLRGAFSCLSDVL